MIYGERVRYAREKLRNSKGEKMSRMDLAVLLDVTQQTIANIENCKDESRKLGFDKMQKLIEAAKLPKGWFFFDEQEILAVLNTDSEVFIRSIPGQPSEVSEKEIKEILTIAGRLK